MGVWAVCLDSYFYIIGEENMVDYWLEIERYPNYEINTKGQVRNIKTGIILKPQTNVAYGRRRVKLNGKYEYVDKLMVENFFDVKGKTNYKIIHLDGNIMNNDLDNLLVN